MPSFLFQMAKPRHCSNVFLCSLSPKYDFELWGPTVKGSENVSECGEGEALTGIARLPFRCSYLHPLRKRVVVPMVTYVKWGSEVAMTIRTGFAVITVIISRTGLSFVNTISSYYVSQIAYFCTKHFTFSVPKWSVFRLKGTQKCSVLLPFCP